MGKVIEQRYFDAKSEGGSKYRIMVYRDITDEEGYGVVFGGDDTDRTIAFGHGDLANYLAQKLFDAMLFELTTLEKQYGELTDAIDYESDSLESPYDVEKDAFFEDDLDKIMVYIKRHSAPATTRTEMTVATPAGEIKVVDAGYKNDAESYPGVWIEVNGEGLALAEFHPDMQAIRLVVWDKDNVEEDPIAVYQLTESITKEEVANEDV